MPIVLDGTNGITTPDVESAGPISGTTGTFSGALRASGVATNIYPLVSATAVTASGTAVDFTGIPSWVKRITVMFSGVSLSGSSQFLVQLGDAGGVETTGYVSGSSLARPGTATIGGTSAAGFVVYQGTAATNFFFGTVRFELVGTNLWCGSITGVSGSSTAPDNGTSGGGNKTLSDTLTQVRITTVNGTDTFDAGTINIMYE